MSYALPAVLAGVVIGVLSNLPLVNLGNCCCCMWVIGGGALAAWLLQQNTERGITVAEGLLVGLLAGGIGAVVGLPVSLAAQAVLGQVVNQRELFDRLLETTGTLPPDLREAIERARDSAVATGPMQVVVAFVFSLMVNLIFATLGGLLGALFFRKEEPPALPAQPVPPPPAF